MLVHFGIKEATHPVILVCEGVIQPVRTVSMTCLLITWYSVRMVRRWRVVVKMVQVLLWKHVK